MQLTMMASKRFGEFTLEADFSVNGERTGVFGVSGSGKSTLVGMLAGLVEPDCGKIVLNGDCLFSSSARINLPPEQRRIAMVFQQHALFPHLDVKGNLFYGFNRCRQEHRVIDFDALVGVLELDDLLRRSVKNLSGGEKQRVALGRAILANPRLLLMDEPLSALDDTLRFQIIPYLRSVSEQFGIPYLFISHSLVEMRLMTDTVLVVEKGRITDQTGSEQLARNRMGRSSVGYINLLELHGMTERDGMCAYRWDGGELLLSATNRDTESGLFELSSKDLILFKQHPEAISARNLLRCTVAALFESGTKMGVELHCGDGKLISEIVPVAARELGISPGCTVYAACKASAFRRLSARNPSKK
ncbi:MAG: molybdenum ABC transporter ATP-binding protein [Desulfuromonadales bacterium]